MNKLSKISHPIRDDRWRCLPQEWFQECRKRLHNQGFSEYRIEKYIGAWIHAASNSIGWLGYTITPHDETDRLLSAAIESADFDLEKFKLDHTTHPLLLNSQRGWSD